MQETERIKEVLPSASLTNMMAKATILNIKAPYIREGSKYSEILHMILKLRRRPVQVDIRLKQVCSHDVLRESGERAVRHVFFFEDHRDALPLQTLMERGICSILRLGEPVDCCGSTEGPSTQNQHGPATEIFPAQILDLRATKICH